MDLEVKDELQCIFKALLALEQLLSCAFIQGESVDGIDTIVAIINEKLEKLIK